MSEQGSELTVKDASNVLQRLDFGDQGIELKNFEDLWRFSQTIKKAGMVGPQISVESIMISIQKGRELGFPAIQSIHSIPVVKGRPTLEGKAMLALIQAHDVDDSRGPIDSGCTGEGDNRVGWCESWRKGWPKARRTEFTWKMAVTAGLTKPRGERGSASIYVLYGEDMLMWKAVGRHTNKYYSDLTHGLMLQMTAQEVYETAKDITPAAVDALPLEQAPPDPLLAIDAPVDAVDIQTGEVTTEAPVEADVDGVDDPDVCGNRDDSTEPPSICQMEHGHDSLCDWERRILAVHQAKAKRSEAARKGAATKKSKKAANEKEAEVKTETTEDRAARFEDDADDAETPMVCGKGPTGNECMGDPGHEGLCDWQRPTAPQQQETLV